jgi:hypothetical protein
MNADGTSQVQLTSNSVADFDPTLSPASAAGDPTPPTQVTRGPPNPKSTDDLTATAGGSTNPDKQPFTYEYERAKSSDQGAHWSPWGNPGAALDSDLTTRGDWWKAHAHATDGTHSSAWTESAQPLVIVNSPPTLAFAAGATGVTPAKAPRTRRASPSGPPSPTPTASRPRRLR